MAPVQNTRTVMLLRHGEAARPSGVPDRQRALTPAGRAGAEAAGRFLVAQGLGPAEVLVSAAQRTRETWACAEGQGVRHGRVSVEPDLYAAEADGLLARLRGLDEAGASVLLVGHNPGIAGLAALLLGGAAMSAAGISGMAPADLLVIDTDARSWPDLGQAPGRLAAVFRPETDRA